MNGISTTFPSTGDQTVEHLAGPKASQFSGLAVGFCIIGGFAIRFLAEEMAEISNRFETGIMKLQKMELWETFPIHLQLWKVGGAHPKVCNKRLQGSLTHLFSYHGNS